MFEWLRGRRPGWAATLFREDLFEGFTEGSRRVVDFAQEEARHLRHNYTGTEHILLGLLRENEGVAATVLRSLGVDLGEVKERIESIVGLGEEPVHGEVPLTPRSKKLLQLARREALHLDHDYVGTEHLLLGLVRGYEGVEYQGVAARILVDQGVAPDEVRRRVQLALGTDV